jgi:phosphate transport system substrate-binding protein
LNPGLALPDAAIAPVRRADGSGTTFNFTNYLSRVHPEWKTKVGEGTAVNWPLGAGGKGNEGVAAFVSRLPNSIGYVEYSYAKQNKMSYTLLKNKDGVYVAPNEETFKAAAAGANWNQSFYQLITDQPGKNAWPISTATFILMHLKQDKPANATETFKFFTWAFKHGDKIAADLDYVAMPDSVIVAIEKAWSQVKDASGKSVALK